MRTTLQATDTKRDTFSALVPFGCEVNGFQPDEEAFERNIREAIFSALSTHL